MAKKLKGIFITLEGSEGCGKSTQAKLLCSYLKKRKKKVLHLREPGGIKISERIRSILLDVKNKSMTKECEVLLYMAARAQLVDEIVLPALQKGMVVVCDRFLDSTLAYQGYGCGVDIGFINIIGKFATRELKPHLTFLLDMPTHKGLSRILQTKDRIEQRSLKYHNKVRRGYLAIAKKNPGRVKVIKANQSREKIEDCIRGYVEKLFKI
ncbi:MAG: dTMP kinase [Candidatus Aceula meridiana]|nr:dTMP kinase [Candidatus Aceula meridiana]